MAHIHFTGVLTARAEEDAYCRRKTFYVRLTDAQDARAYLPARDARHARRIAEAINADGRETGQANGSASLASSGDGLRWVGVPARSARLRGGREAVRRSSATRRFRRASASTIERAALRMVRDNHQAPGARPPGRSWPTRDDHARPLRMAPRDMIAKGRGAQAGIALAETQGRQPHRQDGCP